MVLINRASVDEDLSIQSILFNGSLPLLLLIVVATGYAAVIFWLLVCIS